MKIRRGKRSARRGAFKKKRPLTRIPRGFRSQLVARNAELKYLDTVPGAVTLNLTGTAVLLNGLAEGSGPSNRVGRRVNMKSLLMRLWIDGTGLTSAQAAVARVVLVLDRQANSATALTFSDLLVTPATYGALAVNNLDNRERFRVLFDRSYALSLNAGRSTVAINKFLRFNPLIPVQYDAATANAADISSGQLWLAFIGTSATVTVSLSALSYCRLRYLDL
ncbi:capsid protein [Circoviridae sp.]|nr:capsid protein [Circoviridae sp.]